MRRRSAIPSVHQAPISSMNGRLEECIRLVRNDNYWGEAGFYETLEFTWVNDSTSRTMAVASGDADFAVEIGSARPDSCGEL